MKCPFLTAGGRASAGGRVMLLAVAFVSLSMAPAGQAQPEPPVVVGAIVAGDAVPDGILTATVSVEIMDGSAVEAISWSQTGGAKAVITGADTATAVLALGARWRYRAQLLAVLAEPPLGPDQLPPNVPLPGGEFYGGLQDRFQIAAVNPFALEEAGLVGLKVDVTTTSGTYSDEIAIRTRLPWKPSAGIRNVPVSVPVLLHAKEQDSYDWRLTPPAGSSAGLNGVVQNPEFTPDVPGLYVVEITDEADATPVTLEIFAGYWRGTIVDQDLNGRPVADPACTGCHREGFVADLFEPWAHTGHAEIFTNNLDTSTHYRDSCFRCHSVGYDPGVDNGGFDEAPDYQAFLDSGIINNPGDNWATVLEDFPATAQLANVQCENCHGPANSDPGLDTLAHGWIPDLEGEPRLSLSSDVCAVCHGEPLRHARFQQWQLSGHANYELAIEESQSGSCSRCHTANGFLAWLPVLNGDQPGDPTAGVTVSWTGDEAHPQTCVTCHDPHAIGTTSGIDTNATVRISGTTPPLIAGFQVFGAGRGAICMTCHNSRRGLRNDATFDQHVGTAEAARAPHGSSQTDVLMGENAYLVNVGVRGRHSLIEDTCVTCHMESTPPPDLLSYNQGGTNHTFFASPEICRDCHQHVSAEAIQSAVEAILLDVQGLIEARLLSLIEKLVEAGNTIDLNGEAVISDADQFAKIADLAFGEFRGRQSITVTFTGDETLGPFRLNDVEVVQPGDLPAGDLYDFADNDLIKAGWNWNLIHNDGSRGAHNPSFALAVLDAARDAVGGLGGPRLRPPPEVAPQ